MVRAGRKRRADSERRNRKTVRVGRKRRVGSARPIGERGQHGRDTIIRERGSGKNNASGAQQLTQPNKLAVTPERT